MQWQGLPAGGALELTAKTKARSKRLWGGQRMEAAWKGRESEGEGGGANSTLEESLEPFIPKTNPESTESQDCTFHV